MPDADAVAILTDRLHHMPHPNGAVVKLAGASTVGKPPAVREAATQYAQHLSEAIGHTLESQGKRIVNAADIPVTPAAPVDPTQPLAISIVCGLCGITILPGLTIRQPSTGKALVPGPTLIASFEKMTVACPHLPAP